MADQPENRPSVPWLNLVTAAFLAGGVFLYLTPLKSSRPSADSDIGTFAARGRQDLDARLWQDPFAVVQKQAQSVTANPAKARARLESQRRNANEVLTELASPQHCLRSQASVTYPMVLAVMVRAGPYAEDSERRIRTRTAIAQGLSGSRFAPQDGRHIGYYRLGWPLDSKEIAALASSDPPAIVDEDAPGIDLPYEWYAPQYGDARWTPSRDVCNVLVLWLREEDFADAPLTRLAFLLAQLGATSPDGVPASRHTVVIGPATSTGLRKMVEERLPDMARDALKDVVLYAAQPTASDDFLTFGVPGVQGRSVKKVLEDKVGLRFERTIATDDRVLKSLVDELHNRGIQINDEPKDHIVLLAEYDSVYGRALPQTFLGAATRDSGPSVQVDCDKSATKYRVPRNETARDQSRDHCPLIDNYFYLQGIDGKLPGEKTANEKPTDGSSRDEASPFAKESTEGLDQSDYLRRLALQLKRKYLDWKARGDEGTVAVGLLGSDVYDKLMILRALRSELPDAVFFTNNLDARLGHPAEWSAAHNLVVASPYGLTLAGHEGYAPFRDSYQTAAFAATLYAMREAEPTREKPHLYEEPHLYEIGLAGPFELDVGRAGKGVDRRDWVTAWQWISARPRSIGGALLLAIGMSVWALRTGRHAQWTPPAAKGRHVPPLPHVPLSRIVRELFVYTPAFVGFAVIGVVVLALVVRDFQGPGEEPLVALDGISVWPSEALRLLAGLLSVHFIARSLHKIRCSDEEIVQDFELAEPEGADATGAAHAGQVSQEMDARRIWADYVAQGRYGVRLRRIATPALLYWAFGFSLVMLVKPSLPVRGTLAGPVDLVVTRLFAVGMLIALLFFVIDAMRLNRGFIHRLTREQTIWPDELLQAAGAGTNPTADACMAERFDIALIAKRTKSIGELIYYPFVVLFLMIVSRLEYFDNWNWPPGLVAILALSAAGAVFAAVSLTRAAEKARRHSLERLRRILFRALIGDGKKGDSTIEAVARAAIAEIEAERRGAFSPWSANPIVGALLLPSGGLSLIALSQLFSMPR